MGRKDPRHCEDSGPKHRFPHADPEYFVLQPVVGGVLLHIRRVIGIFITTFIDEETCSKRLSNLSIS